MRRLKIRERAPSRIPKARTGMDLLETDGGDEPSGVLGVGNLGVELVDLFEGEAFGFVDKEVDEGAADNAEATLNSC